MTIPQNHDLLYCGGRLRPGEFSLPGDGVLPIHFRFTDGSATVELGQRPHRYRRTGIRRLCHYDGGHPPPGRRLSAENRGMWHIPADAPSFPDRLTAKETVQCAFFLCMGALSPEGVTVHGLDLASSQGDRAVLNILAAMGARVSTENGSVTVRRGELKGVAIDAGPIPDLIPVLCVTAAGAEGDTQIFNAGRLRLKESDRLRTTAQLLTALGGSVEEQPNGLLIHGTAVCGAALPIPAATIGSPCPPPWQPVCAKARSLYRAWPAFPSPTPISGKILTR